MRGRGMIQSDISLWYKGLVHQNDKIQTKKTNMFSPITLTDTNSVQFGEAGIKKLQLTK